MNAPIRRQVVGVGRLDLGKGRVPAVVVADHAIDPEGGRAVRIGQHALAHALVLLLRSPGLREGKVETLIAGVPVEHRSFLACERDMIGLPRDHHSRQVRDVLSEGQPAVHVKAR